jgi:hypothetical protein
MFERLAFEQEVARLGALARVPLRDRETGPSPQASFKYLALLHHRVSQAGKDLPLEPSHVDPGIYDGPNAYKVASPLQALLMQVMKQRKFARLRVALIDLTGTKLLAPEFAGYNHKEQVFVASVAKIAALLAAFQLQHDVQAEAAAGADADLGTVFARMRAAWARTQVDPGGRAAPLGGRLARRGRLILSGGARVAFGGTITKRSKQAGVTRSDVTKVTVPKLPRLEAILESAGSGPPLMPRLVSSRQSPGDLESMARRFNSRQDNADAIGALGIVERVSIAAGGDVPISNFAVSTVIRDLGFGYIASVLLQTGLFDPNRNGGLWLGRDYWRMAWQGLPVNGQSATAGSLAAFLVLLMQDRLVSPAASAMMRRMLKKPPELGPATGSWFQSAFGHQPLRNLFAKVGLAAGVDEIALIERDVRTQVLDAATGSTAEKTLPLRYAVVALRAPDGDVLASLVAELDRCIQINNGASATP